MVSFCCCELLLVWGGGVLTEIYLVGAIGDPASLGVSALLIGKTDPAFLAAAERQKNYLFQAPKWANGAISHRVEVAELW